MTVYAGSNAVTSSELSIGYQRRHHRMLAGLRRRRHRFCPNDATGRPITICASWKAASSLEFEARDRWKHHPQAWRLEKTATSLSYQRYDWASDSDLSRLEDSKLIGVVGARDQWTHRPRT